MPKPTHRDVKFSKEEMEYDAPGEGEAGRMPFVGVGREGMEMARRISRAHGSEKRRLIESLPRMTEGRGSSVQLEPDVAAVFKDSKSVNKVLRALIETMPASEKKKFRKTG